MCPSFESCEFLHFKYTLDQSDIYRKGALCEVSLVYGVVNLPYYGTNQIDSMHVYD